MLLNLVIFMNVFKTCKKMFIINKFAVHIVLSYCILFNSHNMNAGLDKYKVHPDRVVGGGGQNR